MVIFASFNDPQASSSILSSREGGAQENGTESLLEMSKLWQADVPLRDSWGFSQVIFTCVDQIIPD